MKLTGRSTLPNRSVEFFFAQGKGVSPRCSLGMMVMLLNTTNVHTETSSFLNG